MQKKVNDILKGVAGAGVALGGQLPLVSWMLYLQQNWRRMNYCNRFRRRTLMLTHTEQS